ncbi:MAG: hypothetical protein PUG30_01070 [Actinomycetaceae bacterium]|nr:hypothetical protein [Actinomycetaceae bacterium]
MWKLRKIALIIAASAIALFGILTAFYFNLVTGLHITNAPFDKSYLVKSITSGNNTVDIYQHDDQVRIDA